MGSPGLTSIIIPTYNHASVLPDAIASALKQTAPVEVIVVDDGSTDDTPAILWGFFENAKGPNRFVSIRRDHAGPSAARNAGINAALGEFIMFLDADDVIAPNKVEVQRSEFSEEIGWVLCDVEIIDPIGRRQLASDRYRYAQRGLGGWIREQLAVSNFIPIMAPLIRRSVLTDDVRFEEQRPEDWHFLYRLAAHARVRYVPHVLATYRQRPASRNREGAAHVAPTATDGPVLLNLGCGTPGALSWHPMPKPFINLDRSMGWMFEQGLPQFHDGSVAGVTISHALMYVHEDDWPDVFAEFARVLKPGGVVRITEDDTVHPLSTRRGGWKGSEPAITLTSPDFVRRHLEAAGLRARDVDELDSYFGDASLCQAQHGAPPDVFFIEGVKP